MKTYKQCSDRVNFRGLDTTNRAEKNKRESESVFFYRRKLFIRSLFSLKKVEFGFILLKWITIWHLIWKQKKFRYSLDGDASFFCKRTKVNNYKVFWCIQVWVYVNKMKNKDTFQIITIKNIRQNDHYYTWKGWFKVCN